MLGKRREGKAESGKSGKKWNAEMHCMQVRADGVVARVEGAIVNTTKYTKGKRDAYESVQERKSRYQHVQTAGAHRETEL